MKIPQILCVLLTFQKIFDVSTVLLVVLCFLLPKQDQLCKIFSFVRQNRVGKRGKNILHFSIRGRTHSYILACRYCLAQFSSSFSS